MMFFIQDKHFLTSLFQIVVLLIKKSDMISYIRRELFL